MSLLNRILILLGSPRKKGNSAILADHLSEGASVAGAEVESIYLHNKNITPCSHCDGCKVPARKLCVVQDDMQSIYKKIHAADIVVLVSPVYWFNYSAQLKLVIDRGFSGFPNGRAALQKKKIGIILTFGGSDLEDSGGIHAINSFKHMFSYLKSPIIQILTASSYERGEILQHPSKLEEAEEMGKKLAVC